MSVRNDSREFIFMGMNTFLELAQKRYSCRIFIEKTVEAEKLQLVLEAGRIAPTATNAQPVRVFVLKSESALSKIRKATPMAYNAPVVLMVCYDSSISYRASKYNDPHDSGYEDGSIVTTHMMLEAKDLGLDTLWARGFNAQDIEKAFDLPPQMKLVCLLDGGYADPERGNPSQRHRQRIPMEEFSQEL